MNYRPRLTSIRDVASRETPAIRDENGDLVTDLDACRELLFAVLENALRDYAFIRRLETQRRVSAPHAKRRAAIQEIGDLTEFFEGPWFEDICFFLGLDPDSVRDLLESRASELAQAS